VDDLAAPPEAMSLRALLREDFERYDRRVSLPGLHAIVVHRIGRRTLHARSATGRVVHGLAKLASVVVRNVYGIEVGFSVDVGRRVMFAHQGMIVVNASSRIGNDCLIRHGVTLGARNDRHPYDAPQLRDRVEVGVNAVLVGRIVIGEDARIGPATMVFCDVPAGARVLAPAATVRVPEHGATQI